MEYKGFKIIMNSDESFMIINTHTQKTIKPYLGSDGYMHVSRKENKKTIRERVHVIIAKLFIENPNNLKYINHIDSDKTNNKPSNLEWCTNSQNVKHGWDSGNRTHKNNTKCCAYKDGEAIGNWSSIRKMCEELGVNRHTVARILKRERKNNYPYDFEYYQCPTTIENISTM